jgi:probable O-glycosylation ligase (exosortase A-associated)
MITEALFLISYLILLPIAFMFPFGGALAYEWLQYMPPNSVYNAGAFSNLSLIIGAIALSLWAARDKKVIPKPTALFAIFVIYALWLQFTELVSIVPNGAGHDQWDRSYKTLGFTIILAMMARTQQRVEAFLWVVCLSIGNFVIMGAIKTVLSGGGGNTVIGADGNILGERVSFAIAVTTIIPLVRYLRDHATIIPVTRRVRMAMDIFTVLCVLATVGTQARTGFLSLAVLSLFYFVKSKRKLIFLMIMPIFAAMIYFVAPEGYFDRMNTIGDTTESSSAGRIDAWEWGWKFALEHPITGGGYHAFVLHQTGTIDNPAYLEAHNIFFETMADHGFVGLGLLLLLMLGMVFNCQTITKKSRKVPDLAWAANLGTMLQLAMWTFVAGSQFLADATQSMPYELCALSMATRAIVERRLAQEPKSVMTANLTAGPQPPVPAVVAVQPKPAVPGLAPSPAGTRVGARAPAAYGVRRT